MFVNGFVSRKKWRLRANRDSRRLKTAVPALIYGEGDPQVILVECRGQPLRWRKSVSTHALIRAKFGCIIINQGKHRKRVGDLCFARRPRCCAMSSCAVEFVSVAVAVAEGRARCGGATRW